MARNSWSREQLATGPHPQSLPPMLPADLGRSHGDFRHDTVDVAALGAAVKDHWRFVAGFAAATMCVVMIATLFMHMDFKSSGRLYLGELDAKTAALGTNSAFDISGAGQSDLASEIEIIKSRAIVSDAVIASGINASVVPSGWSPPRYWRWLLTGRDPHLLRGDADELAVAAASLPEGQHRTKKLRVRFVSSQDYLVKDDQKVVAKGTLDVPLVSASASFTLRSMRHPVRAGAVYDLTIVPLEELVDEVIARLSVSAPKTSPGVHDPVKVITLEYVHRSPFVASALLKSLMQAYLGTRQSWKTEDAAAAESFVANRLAGMREALDGTEKKLADYRSNTRVVVLDNEARAMIEQMTKYEERRVAARLQVASLSDIKRVLKDPNPPVEAYLLGETGDTVLDGLGKSLANARETLADLQGRFHEAAPDVRNQHALIASQLTTIRNYVNSRLAREQESLGALNGIIGQFEDRLKTVPGAELGLAQLARESEVYSKLYSYLLERQQQAAIVKASTVSKNRVLDEPAVPRTEHTPQLMIRLASGLLGLLLGIAIVVLRRFLSATPYSSADVRAIAPNVRIFANVPRNEVVLPKLPGRRTVTEAAPSYDAVASDASSPFAEAFRTLRTCLYGAGRQCAGQALLVTSPTPGDGKTTSALSLAAMLAADGKWVLVVDADLRHPSHHLLTRHSAGRGLSDVLRGQCKWQDVVHPIPLPAGEFYSIGAGSPATAELLAHEPMARFLAESRERYDFIIIDAASFPLVADALVIAPLVEGVISVIRLRHTPLKLAAEHVEQMSATANAHALVVNGTARPQRYPYSQREGQRGRRFQSFLSTLRGSRSQSVER